MAFQKGQSGNPGGRPSPARKELDTLLGKHYTAKARARSIERLIEFVEDSDPDVAMEAIKTLLAYTYGKPTERKEVTGAEGAPIKVYAGFDIADV